ncbi:MAG: hypothetical protein H7A51_07995 [Akkermansiaceae bacterium]|nr:hypothetical protein [Akkermansiaceae bacterium]
MNALHILHTTLATSLLVVTLITSAAAQDQAPVAKVRLLAFARIGEDLAVRILDPEGEPVIEDSVPLPTQQLSAAAGLKSRSLVFVSPKNDETILAKAKLPATGREFILVFLPSAKDGKYPYFVHALPMPKESFGSGDYAFLNYSHSAIGCKINDAKLIIPKGKCSVYKSGAKASDNKKRSIVCYEQQANGKWATQPFFSSRLIIQSGVRNLILISHNPRTKRIDFRGIADFVEK